MKEQELRIGSYIQLSGEDYHRTITGFNYFTKTVEVRTPECKFACRRITLEEANPIPLNIEWFIKLGFDNVGDIYFSKDPIYIEDDDGMWSLLVGDQWVKHIFYVHDLQNIYFDLKGCELRAND